MNELITKEMVELGISTDYIYDKIEEYKTAVEWLDTFKFQFKKFCEENGYNKWETDYFVMNYIGEETRNSVKTDMMKKTNIFVVDSETGELAEVNAYEYFCGKSQVKAHVKFREKK